MGYEMRDSGYGMRDTKYKGQDAGLSARTLVKWGNGKFPDISTLHINYFLAAFFAVRFYSLIVIAKS